MNSAVHPALDLTGISKRFGATRALSGVSLSARRGAVHALLGENGAGKSTLMNIAFGVLRPDEGAIAVNGTPLAYTGRPRVGVGMVHQHLSLVPAMTAAENFALGVDGLRPGDAPARLERLGRDSGMIVPVDARVADLSIVQQQRLEILKALGREASVLIMDEPTAVLAPADVRDILEWLRRYARSGGTVILVTHKLHEALSIADEITVLRRGLVAWSGPASGATAGQLAAAIFPDRAPERAVAAAPARGDVCVRARSLTLRSSRGATELSDASFEIARGEIVGIAAVEGAGHRALLSALAGLRHVPPAMLQLPDRIAFVPADRRRDAIVPAFNVTENVALRGLGNRRGVMPWRELRARTAAIIERFRITAPSPESPIGSLSGGNQQRLVLGRELEGATDLVVADNPTRGLDMQATEFVHDQLRSAASTGAAVVVHSSDLDEVLSLATRVLVVFQGTVRSAPEDRESIGRAMLGLE